MAIDIDLTGMVLIALPRIGDPRFERAVILVCAHSPQFAMGLMLNRPVDGLDLQSLLEQLDVPMDIPLRGEAVLEGGPVATHRGFVLHTPDVVCEGATIDVDEGVCMTATRDILLAIGSAAAPRRSVLALGYSGWGPGQLETELAANAWLVGSGDDELIFGAGFADKWGAAMRQLGFDPARLQPDAGRA